MEIKVQGKNPYWLYFKYTTNSKGNRITECFINQDKTEIATGRSSCSSKDLFTKQKGKRIALKKALEILGLNKQERGDFWFDYLNQSKYNFTMNSKNAAQLIKNNLNQ